MGVPKRLTEMQQRFAQLLVTNEGRKTPTECAIEAGYDKDSAYVRASELRNPKKYPLVVKYIGEIREEYQKKYEVTYERHISELGKIREAALKKGAFSAANNAEVARGKAAGLYVEQKIIRTGKLDDMSKEEMEKELKSILHMFNRQALHAYSIEFVHPRTEESIKFISSLPDDFSEAIHILSKKYG